MQNRIKSAGEFALGRFNKFGSCAQSVLLGVQQIYPQITDEVITATHAFGGGGAGCGAGQCGALAGGMLAISTIFGRTPLQLGISEAKLNTELNRQLIKKFSTTFSAHTCQDIQVIVHGRTYNNWVEEEAKKCKTPEFKTKCQNLVLQVTEWTVKIISENII